MVYLTLSSPRRYSLFHTTKQQYAPTTLLGRVLTTTPCRSLIPFFSWPLRRRVFFLLPSPPSPLARPTQLWPRPSPSLSNTRLSRLAVSRPPANGGAAAPPTTRSQPASSSRPPFHARGMARRLTRPSSPRPTRSSQSQSPAPPSAALQPSKPPTLATGDGKQPPDIPPTTRPRSRNGTLPTRLSAPSPSQDGVAVVCARIARMATLRFRNLASPTATAETLEAHHTPSA